MLPSRCLCFLRRMRLAVGRTNARASPAANTRPLIIHDHNLLFDLVIIIIIESDELSILVEAFERHHIPAANLEAAAAANAFLFVNRDKVVRLPKTTVARLVGHGSLAFRV
ncbi:protein of unknown function [Hyphomicrobium sp. MC1]|nr:protein of unknown function [Hyphomicrobium sp. MC1]